MDFGDNEEQGLLRDTVAAIADTYGHDYYMSKAASGEPLAELWKELGEGGFIGINTPEDYGGGGMGLAELAIVGEELAAAGCPSPMTVVSPALCASILIKHGSEALRRAFLPRMASGEITLSFAITEPDAGSNSHELATTARRDGDHYVLRGAKYYTSGFDQSSAVIVVARTVDGSEDERGKLSLFLVDVDSPGLDASTIPVQINAPELQYTLAFDDCRVPGDRLIGTEGAGLQHVFSGLNPERIMGAAMCVGITRYALEKATRYAKERAVWGQPIGTHQAIAHPLARSRIALEQDRLMLRKAAWMYDQDMDPVKVGETANMAKFAAARTACDALDRAIQTHGGNGMATEYGLSTLWGMTRIWKIAPVSEEMVLNFVAEHSLGLPKSY